MSISKNFSALLSTFLFFGSINVPAQVVFQTKKIKEAQIKIFETSYKQDADVVVFKSKFNTNVDGNKGVWYFTPYEGECNKIVSFTKDKLNADLKVFFTTNQAEAGWVNKKKKYLMQ